MQVLDKTDDFSSVYERKAKQLGAVVVNPLDFERSYKKYLKHPDKMIKPADMIVWSQGESRILEMAEKCGMCVVGPKWINE